MTGASVRIGAALIAVVAGACGAGRQSAGVQVRPFGPQAPTGSATWSDRDLLVQRFAVDPAVLASLATPTPAAGAITPTPGAAASGHVTASKAAGDIRLPDLPWWLAERLRGELRAGAPPGWGGRIALDEAPAASPRVVLRGTVRVALPGRPRLQFFLAPVIQSGRAELLLEVELQAEPETVMLGRVEVESHGREDDLGLYPVAARAAEAVARWAWERMTATGPGRPEGHR